MKSPSSRRARPRGISPVSTRWVAGYEFIRLDWAVLGITALLGAAATLLFSLVPALQASRAAVSDALRQGGRTVTVSRSRRWLGTALASGQVALTLALVVASALILGAVDGAVNGVLGFDKRNLMTANLTLPERPYADAELRRVVEVRVAGLDVHQLEAVGSQRGREPLEVEPHVDEEVVPGARDERPVRPVDRVHVEAEPGEDAADLERLPEVRVRVRQQRAGGEQVRVDDVGDERAGARRAAADSGGGEVRDGLVGAAEAAKRAFEEARDAAGQRREPHCGVRDAITRGIRGIGFADPWASRAPSRAS